LSKGYLYLAEFSRYALYIHISIRIYFHSGDANVEIDARSRLEVALDNTEQVLIVTKN